MEVDPDFKKNLSGYNLQTLDESADVIYFLDPDLNLRGYNKAWVDFARENSGGPSLQKSALGTNLLSVMPLNLRLFYREAYQKAIYTGRRFDHSFQCSSAEVFRLLQQMVHPLHSGEGVMVMNTLVETHPHSLEPLPLAARHFKPDSQIISMCGHCRKVKDQLHAEKWEWVPQALTWDPNLVSHGLCKACFAFYYPEQFDR